MLGQNVLVAYGTVNIDEALARAAERSARGRATVVVGIVRNPNAECWWVCLARQRADLTWVSAHRLRKQADAQAMTTERAMGRAGVDDRVFERLLNELAENGDEDAMRTLATARQIIADRAPSATLTECFQAAREQAATARANARKAFGERRRRIEATIDDASSVLA